MATGVAWHPSELPSETEFVRTLGERLWHGLPALLWGNLWFVAAYLPLLWLATAAGGVLATALALAAAPVLAAPLFDCAMRAGLQRSVTFWSPLAALKHGLRARMALSLLLAGLGVSVQLSAIMAGDNGAWFPLLALHVGGLGAAVFLALPALCLLTMERRPDGGLLRSSLAVWAVRPTASLSLAACLALGAVLFSVVGPTSWLYLPALVAFYASQVTLLNLRRLRERTGE